MKVTEVKATLHLVLGQYQWQELTATVTKEIDGTETGDEMMQEAIRVCLANRIKANKGEKNEK